MSNYLIQGETLTAIADKVRSKLGDTELIPPEEMPTAVDEVYEKGKTDEYDSFWDKLQVNGYKTDYAWSFTGSIWNDKTFNPKYPITATENANLLFAYSAITEINVDVDLGTTANNKSNVCQGASNLVTIKKIICGDDVGFSNSFASCKSLVNVTFDGSIGKSISFSSSTKLSRASIENIIAHLNNATTTVNPSATFSKTAVNNAFETSEGAADGEASAEWDNLQSTKYNWTISLV